MTRALLAVLGAVAGYLLFGAAGALGYWAVLVNLVTPLPAAVLGMRLGPVWGAVAAALTTAALFATSGVDTALLFALQFGVPATLLPWLLARDVAWDRAAAATLGLMLGLGLLALFVFAGGSDQSAVALVDALVDKEVGQFSTLMEESLSPESEHSSAEADALRQSLAEMADIMRRLFPGMLVAVFGALQLITVGLLAMLVPRGVPGPPFARWRAPELLIWVLIASGFVSALGSGAAQTVGFNLLVILLPVYFLQGLAVVEFFLARKGLSLLWRGLIYVLLLVVNPLPVIVTATGVFDLWADFRKKRINND